MKLDYVMLYEKQYELDKHIETEHQLKNEALFERKVLALLVELSELANETRCFKFWSKKPASGFAVILEEYVDGLHFILSLGLECEYRITELPKETTATEDVTELFLYLFQLINNFQASKSKEDYLLVFQHFLLLGDLLNITDKDIMDAYFSKNKKNHQRQEQGY